jgi:flavin reductase (DIM6/NTAB) family NADH-FMN oxidoreductase RutF
MSIGSSTPGPVSPSTDVTDARQLRRTFGTFATGVIVLTVGGATPHAMTANSFTSVSLDPPLVLVCVGHEAIMHGRLESGVFGVSVLAASQEEIARHFADVARPLGTAQFDRIPCDTGPLTGVPLISGALARFECRLWNSYAGGDHSVFLGRVLSMDRPEREPELEHEGALLFFQGRFRRLAPSTHEPEHREVTA